MNEPMKLAIEGREALVKHLADIEEAFNLIDPTDYSPDPYAGMYGAIEDAMTIQDSIIDQLGIEVSDGRTVGDVIERIVEYNEEAERNLVKVERLGKEMQHHADELTRLFTGATNG